MSTIAIVGVDGAGKTTIANRLLESFPGAMKYVYMGTSIQSSNITLPTSRLILYLKRRAHRRSSQNATDAAPEEIGNRVEYRNVQRGRLAATARLLHRLAEEWFRQIVVWSYQLRGYTVLYDRHFLFEFARQRDEGRTERKRLTDRIHLWIMYHLYPRPDLVIFLDAPPQVLIERKCEWPLEYLSRYHEAFLRQGERMPGFVRVDASRTVEQVYADVYEHVRPCLDRRKRRFRVATARAVSSRLRPPDYAAAPVLTGTTGTTPSLTHQQGQQDQQGDK
jgi:thymidylate kinase